MLSSTLLLIIGQLKQDGRAQQNPDVLLVILSCNFRMCYVMGRK